MSEYAPLVEMPDVESVYRTERGSTYAQFPDSTTIRNRTAANHRDPTEGIQPRSGKTVYMDKDSVNRIGGFLQNPDMATRFVPEMVDGKPTGHAQVVLTEDYGPRKAGSTLAKVPYTLRPEVGMHPVEIWRSESPMGDTGRGIHFGNKITEVHPKPQGGGGAAAKSLPLPIGGGPRPGLDNLSHSLNPLKLARGGFMDKAVQGGTKII